MTNQTQDIAKDLKKYFVSGVKKQPLDERDLIFQATFSSEELPEKYKNPNIREIENQLRTGSCVANATCSALEMMYTKNDGVNLSRMFVYYNAREPYSYLKEQDVGAYVRDGFKSINHQGVCSESTWPFIESRVNLKPSTSAYDKAVDNFVLKYERLQNTLAIKSAVYKNQAVTFGIPLRSEFFRIKGPLATQNYRATGSDVGGHAMAIVGWDDSLKGFIIENSWGTSWGDKGLGLIKYDIFDKYYYDVWTATELNFEISKKVEPEVKLEDDLVKIVGIGKVYKRKLNKAGFFTFEDIAGMSEEQIQIMEVKHSFKGDFKKSVQHAKEIYKKLNEI